MAFTLKTDLISAANITSRTLVGSYVATADGVVFIDLRLTGLSGSAVATIIAEVVLTRAMSTHAGPRWADTTRAAAETTFARPGAFALPVNGGDQLDLYIESSNAADTGVSGDVIFRDGSDPSRLDATISSRTTLADIRVLGLGDVDVIDDPSLLADTASTSFDVANGDRFRIGDQVQEEGSQEVMLVTEVSVGTITVVRGYAGTTPEGLHDGHVLRIMPPAAVSVAARTIESRLTSGRADNLDNLDAAVSTRSTHSAEDAATATAAEVTADHGEGSYVDAGPADVSALALEASLQQVKLKTDLITAGAITVEIGSHIASPGDQLTLVQGETYAAAIGNAIVVNVADNRLPATLLTDGSVPTLRIEPSEAAGTPLAKVGAVTAFDVVTSTATLQFELTRAESAALKDGPNRYELDVHVAGDADSVLTLVAAGRCRVVRQIA